MKKHITQEDIARLANVTRQTVSLVVNEDPRISEDTRQRILQIMKELNYQPNVTARNLASKRSRCIGYHFFDLEQESFRQPLFTQSLAGIYFRTDTLGYSIKLYRLGTNQDYSAPYRSGEIDGAVFVTYDKPDVEEKLIPLLDKGLPLVIIGSHSEIPHVSINHAHGAKLGLDHLHSKKKKNILYLGGGLDFHSNRQKYEALQTWLKAHKKEENEKLIHHGLYKLEHGYSIVKQALKDGLEFDAVFSAVNDIVATGACQALQQAGVKIPEDIAVLGYDDSEYAGFGVPPLSSIKSPFFMLGQTAIDMIIQYIQEEDIPDSVTLEPELIIREST